MNEHGGIVAFFIFLFLSIIILLQILSMVQSDRLYERINRLEESFKNATAIVGAKAGGRSLAVSMKNIPAMRTTGLYGG